VTLLVDAFVVVGGIALGRWVMHRVRRRARASGSALPMPPAGQPAPTRFPCQLGDVVVRLAEGDEAWLAGAMMLEEEGPVAALFVAPEAGGDRAIFVRDAVGAGMIWLAPIDRGALMVTPEPQHTLEHEGVRYERARRLPVRVARVGSGVPFVGDHAIVAEYAGPSNLRLVVVAGTSETLAWKGVTLNDGEYDVLPGGKETLEA
jgi:hypothetical protein